eukprot:CAMPEP_0180706826 /NCGR_PEP_ID=MMETSP1038_2-20121128/8400_1 /TAXON_ID=632150 /ORGANISM="Azadinium spinosum, Strain 3D9" /LENGTH=109 /DNA_ID=CAMNT_0022738759 /DNA_START=134 /DNA_END=460 /DNA_ORIENTATION=+
MTAAVIAAEAAGASATLSGNVTKAAIATLVTFDVISIVCILICRIGCPTPCRMHLLPSMPRRDHGKQLEQDSSYNSRMHKTGRHDDQAPDCLSKLAVRQKSRGKTATLE